MAAIAAIATLAGTALSAAGAMQSASFQKARYNYEAKVREQQADEAVAAGQRSAADRYRQGRILQSRQQAVAAAAGGDTTDPSVIDIMSDTAAETDLAARTEMYKAENQAKGYRDAAKLARADASAASRAGTMGAISSVIGGIGQVSSMYARFGQQHQRGGQSTVAPLYG